jgi:ankyrin repeat protein
MKSLRIALTAGLIATLSVPVAAQSFGTDSDQFVDAIQKRDGDKAIDLISKHPTIIDAKNGAGDTGLIIAIKANDPDFTGFLLNKGADPNMPGSGGDTPLIAAAKTGFDQAAEWLLGLGARVDGTNKMGETPLIIAVQQRDAALVRLLLKAGADPDRTDAAAGYSARDYATRDQRARDILKMIDQAKPKPGASAAK